MTKETKDTNIVLRVNANLKKELQKLADADHRTLSDYIHIQLEQIVKKAQKKS